jgi:hypothetical protein
MFSIAWTMHSRIMSSTTNTCRVLTGRKAADLQEAFLLRFAANTVTDEKPCHKAIHMKDVLEDDRPTAALLVGSAALLTFNLALAVIVVIDVVQYLAAVWGR